MASYSCNDNQNYFVQEGRTTSRVIQAPGGTTSICLGSDDTAERKAEKTSGTNESFDEIATAGKNVQKAKEEETEEKLSHDLSPAACTAEERVSSNAFASSATTNSYNVLTDRPSSRVLAPPGGKTSISLG